MLDRNSISEDRASLLSAPEGRASFAGYKQTFLSISIHQESVLYPERWTESYKITVLNEVIVTGQKDRRKDGYHLKSENRALPHTVYQNQVQIVQGFTFGRPNFWKAKKKKYFYNLSVTRHF